MPGWGCTCRSFLIQMLQVQAVGGASLQSVVAMRDALGVKVMSDVFR